jgi:hypothetical protein
MWRWVEAGSGRNAENSRRVACGNHSFEKKKSTTLSGQYLPAPAAAPGNGQRSGKNPGWALKKLNSCCTKGFIGFNKKSLNCATSLPHLKVVSVPDQYFFIYL